jgi:ribosome-associated toxin RatA of RatAB toxin-antitoxin module
VIEMTRYDILDEAVLAATPSELAAAFTELGAGRATWWEPYLRMRPLDGLEGAVGSRADIFVSEKGHLDRWDTTRFTAVVREREEGRHLLLEYIDGAFRGTGDWTFEPVDEAHTRVRMVWRAEPHGTLMRLVARLQDVGAAHSRVMARGFEQLEAYVHAQRGAGQPS